MNPRPQPKQLTPEEQKAEQKALADDQKLEVADKKDKQTAAATAEKQGKELEHKQAVANVSAAEGQRKTAETVAATEAKTRETEPRPALRK